MIVEIKCCFCKLYKGARRLKMHQRSCRLILELNIELLEDMFVEAERSNIDSDSVEHAEFQNSDEHEEYHVLRKSINLTSTFHLYNCLSENNSSSASLLMNT